MYTTCITETFGFNHPYKLAMVYQSIKHAFNVEDTTINCSNNAQKVLNNAHLLCGVFTELQLKALLYKKCTEFREAKLSKE